MFGKLGGRPGRNTARAGVCLVSWEADQGGTLCQGRGMFGKLGGRPGRDTMPGQGYVW